MTALASVIVAHCSQATVPVSVMAVVTAAAVLVLGTLVAEKPVLYIGGLAGVIGLGNLIILAFRIYIGHAWLVLAIIGISIMLAASLIETKRPWNVLKNNSIWGMLKQTI